MPHVSIKFCASCHPQPGLSAHTHDGWRKITALMQEINRIIETLGYWQGWWKEAGSVEQLLYHGIGDLEPE